MAKRKLGMISYRLHTLVGLPLAAALFIAGCDSKDLMRSDATSRGRGDVTQAIQEPEIKEYVADEQESEAVVPPANIAGAFLVQCDTFDVALPAADATRVLCALRDTAGKKATGVSISWSVEPAPGSENLLLQDLLPASSKWHVEFLLRADYYRQNAVEVVATYEAEAIRLGKGKFNSSATEPLALIDRTAELNHQAVPGATLGINVDWSQIYQDPVTQLFVSNRLHGDMPFVNSEGLCAQLDDVSPLQGAWRLPSRTEITRMHRLRADLLPGLNDWFWTGETVPEDTTRAFYGILTDGQIGTTPKTNGAIAVFCVADQLQASGG
jgi:hypothetical protein